MGKIKSFVQFNEEISGTELVGPVGPAYGETGLQNKNLNKSHTSLLGVLDRTNPESKNSLTSDLFFQDDYNEIFNNFLKSGGDQSQLLGNREDDIAIMLDFLQEK